MTPIAYNPTNDEFESTHRRQKSKNFLILHPEDCVHQDEIQGSSQSVPPLDLTAKIEKVQMMMDKEVV